MTYSIQVCRAGWLVKKGDLVVSHGHATRESAEDFVWDAQSKEARDEFRKVTAILPSDRGAHPMSGRFGEY